MVLRRLNTALAMAVVVFMLTPLSFELVSFSGKPAYVMLSDIFLYVFLVLVLVFPSESNFGRASYLNCYILAGLLYFTILSFASSIYRGGDAGVVLSYSKYVLPFCYYAFGFLLPRYFNSSYLKAVALFFCFLVFVIVASDVFWGDFPRGCHLETGRWGGCIVGRDVYGFPNSAASLYGLIFLIIVAFIFSGNLSFFLGVLTLFFLSAVMVLTLSRAAWVFLISNLILVSVFAIFGMRKKIRGILLFLFSIVVFFVFVAWFDFEAFLPAVEKFNASMERSDPSSGRFDIWMDALQFIVESPVYGYGFSPFSNYVSGYDTPHQQYLEWAFKAGLIGLLFNISIVGLVLYKSFQISVQWSDAKLKNSFRFFAMSAVFGLVVNGFFQPIFSYTPIANFLFFSLGCMTCLGLSGIAVRQN